MSKKIQRRTINLEASGLNAEGESWPVKTEPVIKPGYEVQYGEPPPVQRRTINPDPAPILDPCLEGINKSTVIARRTITGLVAGDIIEFTGCTSAEQANAIGRAQLSAAQGIEPFEMYPLLRDAYAILDGIPGERFCFPLTPEAAAAEPSADTFPTVAVAEHWLAYSTCFDLEAMQWDMEYPVAAASDAKLRGKDALAAALGISSEDAMDLFACLGDNVWDAEIALDALHSGSLELQQGISSKHVYLQRILRFLQENEAI